MTHGPVIVAPALMRALLEPLVRPGSDIRWFTTAEEAAALAPEAEIGWFDQFSFADSQEAVRAGTRLRWVNTILAGLSTVPVEVARERGIVVTNGRGLNSGNVADYAVMGMLAMAKGLPDIVRAHDRAQWMQAAPGTVELEGSSALIIGYGSIGEAIAHRLAAFGVAVTGVRRRADPRLGILGPDDWRAQIGEHDWIILAAPATRETQAMIGAAELAAAQPGARIVNVARGDLMDQAALAEALRSGRLAGAFLDVTVPEPLPADDPLWSAPNCLISSHMAGRSQTAMYARGAERFAANLACYMAGEPLSWRVDLQNGY